MSEWDEEFDNNYQKENERFDKLMELTQFDITFPQFQGMEMRANEFLHRGRKSSKQERRLAKDLLKCINWIKREAGLNG